MHIGGINFRNVPAEETDTDLFFLHASPNIRARYTNMQLVLNQLGLPALSRVRVGIGRSYFYAFSQDHAVGWVNTRSRLFQFVWNGKAVYQPNSH